MGFRILLTSNSRNGLCSGLVTEDDDPTDTSGAGAAATMGGMEEPSEVCDEKYWRR